MDSKDFIFILAEVAGEFDDLSRRLVLGSLGNFLMLPQNIGKLILLAFVADGVKIGEVITLGPNELYPVVQGTGSNGSKSNLYVGNGDEVTFG
jgi:hypothetical protein